MSKWAPLPTAVSGNEPALTAARAKRVAGIEPSQ